MNERIDMSVDVNGALKVLLALKFNLRCDEIEDTATIEGLSGGNSARRNEIISDIGAEFGISQIDGAQNKQVCELAEVIGKKSNYKAPGRFLAAILERTLKEKFPISYAKIADYIKSEWEITDPSCIILEIPLSARAGDSNKSSKLSKIGFEGRLGGEKEAHEWLDRLVGLYASSHKITIAKKQSGDKVSHQQVDTKILKNLGEKFEKVARDLLSISGADIYKRIGETPSPQSSFYVGELGPKFERVSTPIFDEKKCVTFSSWWNWAKRDLAKLFLEDLEISGAEIKRCSRTADENLLKTAKFFATKNPEFRKLVAAIESGLSWTGKFSKKTALVTGAGPNSIANEVVKCLLAEGGRVVVSTSNYSSERVKYFRRLYQSSYSKGAELYVLPASQGSFQDATALVKWTTAQFGVPNIMLPFGAVSELGGIVDLTPDGSSSSMRVMLEGVLWLISSVAKAIQANGGRCLCVVPLSPNEGQIGGDGLYAEAKVALTALFNKWHREAFGGLVDLVGVKIGWTRGTGLMAANDGVVAEIERRAGIKTYSAAEMGGLITEVIFRRPGNEIIDLTGGFGEIRDIGKLIADIKAQSPMDNVQGQRKEDDGPVKLHPDIYAFPKLPTTEQLSKLKTRATNNERRITVVVGFGEVSPLGNTRSRFEIEANGALTVTSSFELAWLMGLVRYENSDKYVGWIDAASNEPVQETELIQKYGDYILNHIGIREVEPAVAGFDPKNLTVYTDVLLDDDFIFPVASQKEGEEFLANNQSSELVSSTTKNGLFIRLKKGSQIKVQKGVRHTRTVAGQIPTGFEPTRFGLSKELCRQTDRVTQFNLIASAEAFLLAGLTPEELAANISPSKIGNTQGSGIGGMAELGRLYHDFREDRPRKTDTLQETLINTGPAWLTQGYVGAYGPSVHPVGACATALVSIDLAYEMISSGRADFVIAGGFDDINPEGLVGFADMKATADCEEMKAKGMDALSISRPNDSRRGGFVEAHGGGTLLLTSLDKAVQLGLPIYGVVGYTATHSDGYHTSIPAPGLGLLSCAAGGMDSPLARALADFGMSADDVVVVSKHDTSTPANDPNENFLHHLIQKEIGRSDGNPLLVHSQKALLGHAKGGASAWQTNAALQMLNSGLIAGNPNLDDVDPKMALYDTMCFTDQTIRAKRINAVVATSLGFGHVGCLALFIHPDFALAMLEGDEFKKYEIRRADREKIKVRREWLVRMGKEPLFKQKTERLFKDSGEEANYLLRTSGHQNIR